ncbi:MAG: cell division ATP-binding protein FtsE [Tissierellia bacterium]|nr:cell division ATP-binding protein FtsE [Tissierellia bacterium]
MITFKNVYKEYPNGVQALMDINIEIPRGDFVFFVGPSGAGKSTMIKLLIREEKTTRGNIFIDDKDITKLMDFQVPKLRRKVAVVFQDYRLLPKKTVWENVAYALEITGESRRVIRQRVPYVLDLVGLQDKDKSYPSELSGGEGQRLSIARAMVSNPSVLLCDEPTGNLDSETAMTVMEALKRVNEEGATILMASHARDIVNRMKKRVVTLEKGRIISDVQGGSYYEVHKADSE